MTKKVKKGSEKKFGKLWNKDRRYCLLLKETLPHLYGTNNMADDNTRVPITLSKSAFDSLEVIARSKGLKVAGIIRQLAEASAGMHPANYYRVLAAIDKVGRDE